MSNNKDKQKNLNNNNFNQQAFSYNNPNNFNYANVNYQMNNMHMNPNTQLDNQDKKIKSPFKKTLNILICINLVLFSLVGLFNQGVVGNFLNFINVYMFGSLFFFVYFVFLFYGIGVFFFKKGRTPKKTMAFFISGFILLFIALTMFVTFNKISEPSLSTMVDQYNKIFNDCRNPNLAPAQFAYDAKMMSTGGGFVGFFLVSAFSIAKNYGLAVAISIIICIIGLLLVCIIPIKSIISSKSKSNVQTVPNQVQQQQQPYVYNSINDFYRQNQNMNPNQHGYSQYPNTFYYNQNQPMMNQQNMVNQQNTPYIHPMNTPNQQNAKAKIEETSMIQPLDDSSISTKKDLDNNSVTVKSVEVKNIDSTPLILDVEDDKPKLSKKEEKKLKKQEEELRKAQVKEENIKQEIVEEEINETEYSKNMADYPVCPIDIKREEYVEPKKKTGFLAKIASLFSSKKRLSEDDVDLDMKDKQSVDNYMSSFTNPNQEKPKFGMEVNTSNTPFIEEQVTPKQSFDNDIPLTKQASNSKIEDEPIFEQPIKKPTKPVNYDQMFEPTQKKSFKEMHPRDVVVQTPKEEVYTPTPSEKFNYPFPPISLLEDHVEYGKFEINNRTSFEKQSKINKFFEDYKIDAKVESYTLGPAVTRFNIRTSPGVRISTIASRTEELQMYLRGDKSVRVETVVEGRDTPGIEVGNAEAMVVPFKTVYNKIQSSTNPLTIALGTNIDGDVVTTNLDELPHLLVAGTTGSGKSVFIHSIIMSLIMRNYPDQLRLILIDPKKVEFTKYQNVPHLFCRIVDDITQATSILAELVAEMERRYNILSNNECVNLKEYRRKLETDKNLIDMPNIVCIIDEFADLIQQDPDNVEYSVQRLAQKARACGIYLIIATQRPSVKVITGDIKANIPARVALSVSSQVDSRTIIDEVGAETLLGKGDLLARIPGHKSLVRCQSAFINNDEISRVTRYLTKFGGLPKFDQRFNKIQIAIDEDTNLDDYDL